MDLLITNQLLYQLSYTGFCSVESAISARPKLPFYTVFLYPDVSNVQKQEFRAQWRDFERNREGCLSKFLAWLDRLHQTL